jgi:hypothetical protein
MEALSSSETSALIRATRRNVPEDAILHVHTGSGVHFYSYSAYPGVLPPRLKLLVREADYWSLSNAEVQYNRVESSGF